MPNRIIKESICTSETLDQLTAEEERLFFRLTVNCDDFGLLDARPQIIKSKCFPLRDDITAAIIDRWLAALVQAGLIFLYAVDGKTYLKMTNWEKHQQVRASKSKYPQPHEGELISLASNCKQTLANVPVFESESVSESGSGAAPAVAVVTPAKSRNKRKTSMPEDFEISDRVKAWAAKKSYADLDAHLESFRSKAIAKGYQYADWDEGFMGAIREDWAKLRMPQAPPGQHGAALDPRQAENKPHVQPFPQRARS